MIDPAQRCLSGSLHDACRNDIGHACAIIAKLVLWPLHQHTLSYLASEYMQLNSVTLLFSTLHLNCNDYISFFHQNHFNSMTTEAINCWHEVNCPTLVFKIEVNLCLYLNLCLFPLYKWHTWLQSI